MISFLLRLGVLLSSLILPMLSYAADDACHGIEKYRNEAKALVYKAQAADLTGIDGFSYSDIIKALDKPCLQKNPRNMTVRQVGREHAYYEPTMRIVYLNAEPLEKLSAEERAPLILHELLGAAGYPDRQYQMTLQIVFVGKKGLQPKSMMITELKSRDDVALSGGSGTSVGGGGDSFAIQIKIAMLDTLRNLEIQGVNSINGLSTQEVTRLTLDCPLEFASDVAVVKSIAVMKNFMNGLPKSDETYIKVTAVPMLYVFLNKTVAKQVAISQIAAAALQSLSQEAAKYPSQPLCKIPFYPAIPI